MIFKVIKNTLKVLMAWTAIYGILSLKEINTLNIVLIIIAGIAAVGYVVFNALDERPKPLPLGPHGEIPEDSFGEPSSPLTEKQVIIEGFINDILDYCSSKNTNCTITSEPDGLWVVNVNDETGQMDKIINLSIPS